MAFDHKDIMKATYNGNTPSDCAHIIQSYLEFTRFDELIEERCNRETGRQYQSLEPFKDWWNDYISDEDWFVEEGQEPEQRFPEHQTSNLMFAIAAFKEGLEVWIADPTEPDERLHQLTDIVDADGRLFVIKKGEAA